MIPVGGMFFEENLSRSFAMHFQRIGAFAIKPYELSAGSTSATKRSAKRPPNLPIGMEVPSSLPGALIRPAS